MTLRTPMLHIPPPLFLHCHQYNESWYITACRLDMYIFHSNLLRLKWKWILLLILFSYQRCIRANTNLRFIRDISGFASLLSVHCISQEACLPIIGFPCPGIECISVDIESVFLVWSWRLLLAQYRCRFILILWFFRYKRCGYSFKILDHFV